LRIGDARHLVRRENGNLTQCEGIASFGNRWKKRNGERKVKTREGKNTLSPSEYTLERKMTGREQKTSPRVFKTIAFLRGESKKSSQTL